MSFRDNPRGRGPQQPPLPKPYTFVPLPDGRIPLSAPAGHHRLHANRLNGTLTGLIVARSPVHIASGILEQVPRDRDYPLVKGHFRSGGIPTIPATSLKGCIRSIVEALSRSTVTITRSRELSREYLPGRSPEQLDVAQRIFGALGYQGLLRFADAPQTAGRTTTIPTPQLYRPRPESYDTYFDGRRPRGRKFYMHGALAKGNLPLEACEVDSRFALRADFTNLTPGELGLVLIAMGLGEPSFCPKIGGGKPACLGTIEVTDIQLSALDPRAAYTDFEPAPTALNPDELIEAAHSEALVQSAQLAAIAATLRWPRADRNCPERNY